MTLTLRFRDDQAHSSRVSRWRVPVDPQNPIVFRVRPETMEDLIPYPTTSADWIAWGRAMTGGDISDMLDTY